MSGSDPHWDDLGGSFGDSYSSEEMEHTDCPELRAERVRGPDGTEEKMLSFWSILVLSVLVGCICCVLSWTLTYLDSQQTAMVSSSPSQTLAHIRDGSDRGFHLGYGVAVLNGIMASLTVVWSLT